MENKDRLYGQLVVDFANAKPSDEACLRLLERMQDAFDLSRDFADRVKAAFLTNSKTPDIDPQEIWAKYNETIELLERQFNGSHCSPREWDHSKQSVCLDQYIENESMNDDEEVPVDWEISWVSIKDLPAITNTVKRETTDQLIDLIKLIYRIEGSDHIANFKNDLQDLLTKIVNRDRLAEDELLKTLLNVYNEMTKRYLITDDGTIVEAPVFQEQEYITKGSWESPAWASLIRKPLAYALVRYLLSDNSKDYIHKCKGCEKYFVAKTRKKSRQFCEETCHNAYHNRKRIESGEAREYKKKRREEAAKASDHG